MESTVMTEELGMDDLLAQSDATKPGAVVEGTVVGQTDSHLLVNVGLKQEAALPLRELAGAAPQSGDKISVLIVRMSGPEGRPLVSFRQARERKNWDKIAEAQKAGAVIDGKIVQRIKGGFTVDIGLDAFMPASQADDKPVARPEEWVGRAVRVVVLEMDPAKGNVLVSRRRVVEQEKSVKRAGTLAALEIGKVYQGTVTGLTKFGAFVDIGGVEGLLHVSDLAWTRVDNPQTVLKAGDAVEVKVLKYDAASGRISLGRKQLLPHPWEGIDKRFPIGSLVKGKVTGLAEFGAFVELAPGIEGLIHVSELSWTERVKRPHGILKTGQEIETRIIGIDREKEKISLSLRRVGPSPWEQAFKQFPVGSKVEGEVTHIAPFGAFVKIPGGIEALLKTQDLSWTERIASPQSVVKVGDKITAVVLEVNPNEEKMALGIKQLSPDPLKQLRIGQTVTGQVVKITGFGAFVRLDSGLDGLIRSSEMQLDRSIFSDKGSPKASEQTSLKEGETVQASVLKVNKKDRKIELSIRRYERDQERELLRKYSGKSPNPTLGEATGWDGE